MKKMLALLGFLLVSFSASFAQNDTSANLDRNFKRGYHLRTTGYLFSTNLSLVWMTNMQQFLKPLNLSDESQLIGSIPFEAGVRFGDWFFNLNTAFPGVLGDDFKPNLTTASLLVERTVFKSRNYRFNVGGGASLYEYSLSIVQNEPDRQVAFQDLLNTTFKSTPYIYNRGGAIEVSMSLSNREKKSISFGNCFRLGYRHGFKSYRWKSKSFQLLDAPVDNLNMLYFQYMISISRNSN